MALERFIGPSEKEIKDAKVWLAHFHKLQTGNPIAPEQVKHTTGKDGKVTFSVKGASLFDASDIRLPGSYRVRSGRGDKEFVIEKRNPLGLVAIVASDGSKLHTFDPGFLTRFLITLKAKEHLGP